MGRPAKTPPSKFWERLAEAWGAVGLPITQNGVAKKLPGPEGQGMSQGATRRWYTGDGLPDIQTIIEIARLGRCSIHWLLTGDGPRTVTFDPDTTDLLRHWSVLQPAARAAVLRMAKMEHAIQFTGDPAAREAFERSLETRTTRYMVQDKPK